MQSFYSSTRCIGTRPFLKYLRKLHKNTVNATGKITSWTSITITVWIRTRQVFYMYSVLYTVHTFSSSFLFSFLIVFLDFCSLKCNCFSCAVNSHHFEHLLLNYYWYHTVSSTPFTKNWLVITLHLLEWEKNTQKHNENYRQWEGIKYLRKDLRQCRRALNDDEYGSVPILFLTSCAFQDVINYTVLCACYVWIEEPFWGFLSGGDQTSNPFSLAIAAVVDMITI